MEDFSRHCPFTQFAHHLLVRSELSESISHLQHQSGFNINIIFYSLWVAKSRYGRLTRQNLKVLQSQIALWHQRVIAELKYTHALVADHKHPAAIQIKQALQEEIIKAHIIEQCMLYDSGLKTHLLRRSSVQQLADACASMIHYCELKNDLLIDEDQAAFIQLSLAVFDDIKRSDIEKQIKSAFDRFKVPTTHQLQMMWEAF